MRAKIDISIYGQGFYTINGETKRGQSWLRNNVQGAKDGTVNCDDQNMTQAIAEGAARANIHVSVNDFVYLLGGLRGESVL